MFHSFLNASNFSIKAKQNGWNLSHRRFPRATEQQWKKRTRTLQTTIKLGQTNGTFVVTVWSGFPIVARPTDSRGSLDSRASTTRTPVATVGSFSDVSGVTKWPDPETWRRGKHASKNDDCVVLSWTCRSCPYWIVSFVYWFEAEYRVFLDESNLQHWPPSNKTTCCASSTPNNSARDNWENTKGTFVERSGKWKRRKTTPTFTVTKPFTFIHMNAWSVYDPRSAFTRPQDA